MAGLFVILLCAEDTVAGIAQTGYDVSVVVQLLVQSGHVNVHIGVRLLHRSHTLGCADDVHHHDALAAVLLQKINGCHSAAAGGQHGVNHENTTVFDVIGQHFDFSF